MKYFAAFIILFLSTRACFAWGVLGHRIVGGIADQHLTPATRAQIKKILGNESLAMASNYADFIKSDRSYDYISPWHYINLPSGFTDDQLSAYLQKDTSTNLYTRLRFIVKELKNKKLTADKHLFYFRLLIHFVGDAHQPMHTARPTDRGGNDIKVFWFNNPTNLHRVWDEHLVEFQQLSYTEHIAAINFTTLSQRQQWQKQPVSQWIIESYREAEKIYAAVKPDDRLGFQHNYQFVAAMNRQLLKGGIRLAGLLNEIYGS